MIAGIQKHHCQLEDATIAPQSSHNAGAYRMGHIPKGHLGGKFLGRNPMHQQPVARPEPGSLEKIVKNDENGSDRDKSTDEIGPFRTSADPSADGRTPSEKSVKHDAGSKCNHQMPAGIRTVCNEAVSKFTEPVYQTSQSEDKAEAGILYTVLRSQHRHGEREVLTHEIEHRIAYHRADDNLPLPIVETLFGLHWSVVYYKNTL